MDTSHRLAAGAASAVLLLGMASTAMAESTVVSFGVTSGTLAITQGNAGAAVDLGDASFSITGTSVEGSLNSITVTDNQAIAGVWCVSVSLSDGNTAGTPGFVKDGSTEVDGSNGSMFIDATDIVSNAGSMTLASTHTTAALGVTLDNGGQLVNGVTVLGGGSVTYTPKLKVTIPGGTATGDYSGTITHTASTTC